MDDDLAIDTGKTGFIGLPRKSFDRLRDASAPTVISSPTLTANGAVERRELRVSAFEMAGMKYRDADFTEEKRQAVCGLDFLERHLVTLDFPRQRLYLKPGKEFAHLSARNLAGASRW
ncbi:MAG TPA: hypothetical protein VG269_10820 [Tepidisphaeraceae bacterium]|nr:hypothetical protein [Tepidisphaeraceae bacterium]